MDSLNTNNFLRLNPCHWSLMKQHYFFKIFISCTLFISLWADDPKQEYDTDFIALVEMIYGEGILSQGGIESIDEIFSGADLNGKKILDLGSGLGMFDLYLAKKYSAEILGIEPQSELIERANQYLDDQKDELIGSVSFILMENTSNLEQCQSDLFDIIFSKEAILHVPNAIKQSYFNEIYRVLKPGGKIFIMDWMHTSPNLSENTKKMMEMDGIVYELLTPFEYQDVIKNAGFAEIDLVDLTFRSAQNSEQNLITIKSLEEAIKLKFGEQMFEYCLESWGYQKEAFLNRELITGIFRAIKSLPAESN